MKRIIAIISLFLVLLLSGLIWFKFYFSFGEGVKAGELNYMVYKGIVFKTYEGKLIQSGFRSSGVKPGSAIQSYEFEFSVKDKEIAEVLMLNSGKDMELRETEYRGAFPWRGFSRYIVTEIISINNKKFDQNSLFPKEEKKEKDNNEIDL